MRNENRLPRFSRKSGNDSPNTRIITDASQRRQIKVTRRLQNCRLTVGPTSADGGPTVSRDYDERGGQSGHCRFRAGTGGP